MPLVVDMPLHGECAAGAAMRQRQRQLRSWLRHERMTVAMTLAELTHQGRGGGGERDVRRSTGTEVSTFGGAARHPCGARVPLLTLGLPVLAGALGEQVDSSSLRCFAAADLRHREEKERKKELEELQEAK